MRCCSSEAIDVRNKLQCLYVTISHGMILEKKMEGHAIMSEQSQQQFDSSLKDLVQEDAAEIIPHFLEGAQFIDTLNVEIIRPTMRADGVYLVQ